MSEVMLKKHLCIPFLATTVTTTGGTKTYTWKRIDKSTIFALGLNPQEETMDYISQETPVTVIDGYQPELPQEIALYEGNPIYDFVFGLVYDLPVGNGCNVPVLICFPTESDTAADKKAWLVDGATLSLGEFNTVDGKITFTLKLGGDIIKGTYEITDGAPVFSNDTIIGAALYDVTAPVTGETPQSTHVAGTGYTAAIAWSPVDTTFAADTVYTATVTYTATAGFVFAGGFSETDITGLPASGVTSKTVTRVSRTSVTAVVVYNATAE
jgi:hypothetical protein